MKRIGGESGGSVTGYTRKENTYINNELSGTKYEILILTGLPRYLFIATAAHELMHIWLHTYCPENLPEDVVEGSCNYASSIVLSEFNHPRAQFQLSNLENAKDPIYGQGFQKIKEYAGKFGQTRWLAMLRGH